MTSWDGLVVICAGTPWDGIPSSEHHIADRLANWAPVLYVDPPKSILALLRYRDKVSPTLLELRPGLARLSPVVFPGLTRPLMVRVTEHLVRLYVRWAIWRLGGKSRIRVIASDMPVFERGSSEQRVLFATDDFSAGAELMGLPKDRIQSNEERLARESDLVIVVSELLGEKWKAMGCKVVVVPNGCDTETFAGTESAPWPIDVVLPSPICGFVGQINDRLDISLMEAVADRGVSVLLVGPSTRTFDVRRLDGLLKKPNVQWVGPKSFEQMPSYLRAIHVGLTPYSDTPFNRASFPLKTVEYLAAGRSVVSTDLPAARWLANPHLTIAGEPQAFADAVEARLKEPLSDQLLADRRAFAAAHSWSARASQFANVIGAIDR